VNKGMKSVNDRLQKKDTKQELARRLEALDRQRQKAMQELEKASGVRADLSPYNGSVYLLVDCSTSMEGEKIEQAKQGAIGFAQDAHKKGFRTGLIMFTSGVEHLLEPTSDLAAFTVSVKRLTAYGSTNMAAAIHSAITYLRGVSGEQVICIVTDGLPDDPNLTLSIAREARNLLIDIITIGTDDADKAFLDQIATRKELSIKVERKMLRSAITNMAKLLPEGGSNSLKR
jgi:Mg-chelatase subunit ChlD